MLFMIEVHSILIEHGMYIIVITWAHVVYETAIVDLLVICLTIFSLSLVKRLLQI